MIWCGNWLIKYKDKFSARGQLLYLIIQCLRHLRYDNDDDEMTIGYPFKWSNELI